uniref:Protein YIF1 n=1 Tax=Ciona intestinalis TaxID=7719 RepID=F6WPS3_CIOIN|nr:protein YIF1B-like isoform X1 [Ciona intestinalis]|eukprot:XP_002132175.1 protein YIF1B-like isoform X1 [Ciona intestinalis]
MMDTTYMSNSQARQRGPLQEPQLFEDTSQPNPYEVSGGTMQPGAYNLQPGMFPGQQILNDPMANMAMQYGQSLAGHGKEMLEKNVDKYISMSKLKYYFAVDTSYVAKKLALLSFPFTHQDWSVKYHQDSPVAPRFDINAPDLYIPVMAYVTYILIAGISIGMTGKFTPEVLGIQASSALVWLAIEVGIVLLSLYIVNARTDLSTWDVIAYSGYKYVGMIIVMIFGIIFHSMGYWCALGYTSISISFFLLKTLRLKILPHSSSDGFGGGGTRRMYLTFIIALLQPLFMFWLTRHLVGQSTVTETTTAN